MLEKRTTISTATTTSTTTTSATSTATTTTASINLLPKQTSADKTLVTPKEEQNRVLACNTSKDVLR